MTIDVHGDAPDGEAVGYRAYDSRHLDEIGQRFHLDEALVADVRRAAAIFPFRVNEHVLTELIDWARVPDDPIFRLVFPTTEMLPPSVRPQGPEPGPALGRETVAHVRLGMNPHPASQLTKNAPLATAERPGGIQHKYAQTVLFFPTEGQTCHAYCTFCFRWPQFVGDPRLRFGERDAGVLVDYLRRHPEVRDVLITGGDALFLRARTLRTILTALAAPGLEHIETIRLGTKALTYWPQRVISDDDASDLLHVIEEASGRWSVAVMAHVTHPRELLPRAATEAIRLVRSAGAKVYCQAPVLRHVNDSAPVLADLWRLEARLGCVPYYMFVERDTGAREYFEVPLARSLSMFREAYSTLPGLARTIRGPVMSADPGKVVVDGVSTIDGQRRFALRYVQARDPTRLLTPFFARFDESATWFDQLQPATSDDAPFFP